jgi:hypothetical protein
LEPLSALRSLINTFLLDIVEVAKSHTGMNLAAAFVEVLEAFGIKDKVSDSNTSPKSMPSVEMQRSRHPRLGKQRYSDIM